MANDLPDHVRRNRDVWNRWAADYAEPGRANWSCAEPRWGIWGVPESALGVLPPVDGRDSIELGCGTGYVSAWLARRGARAIGLDLSSEQLATARALQREFGLVFPLVQASAETVPLAGDRFDLVISEYGACLWADPYRWVPEAARLLRPGGNLVFLTNAFLLMLCLPDEENAPATDRLVRDAFGMHRLEWTGSPEVELSPPARQVDRAAAEQRVRGGGSDRAASRRGRDLALPLRAPRLGASLAVRGDLEGPTPRLT